MKVNNSPVDQFDRMMSKFLGIPTDKYIAMMNTLDEEQKDVIISRLLSDDDKEIEEGKEMFNDIDEV